MFEKLKGKRLLYLGGIKRAEYVVKRAKQLGIYVVVADYNEDSPAKSVADEGVLVDAMDTGALIQLCKEKHIDGIMTGYADILMPICFEVAQAMNFSCYYTEEMLRAATDKEFFKSICNKNDVPVPYTIPIDSNNYKTVSENISYPVFIKPLDASGARGADVCTKPENFAAKFEYALSFSKKKEVTVEEFLHGTEFILDYLIIDGTPHLLSMADRYTIPGRPAAINSPNLMILPSANINRYIESVNEKVCKMFEQCNFMDGLIFIQGYADENRIAFYEMGCRLGGTWPYIDEYFTGINPMDMLFSHALTGSMIEKTCDIDINPRYKGKAGIIYFLSNCTEGKIAKVLGVDKLKNYPGVVDVMQFYDVGDSFDMNRQTDVRLLSVHIVASDFKQLKERINDIYSFVDFVDCEGNSLLSTVYDMSDITQYD